MPIMDMPKPEIMPEPCMWRSSNQLVTVPQRIGSPRMEIMAVNAACPKSSKSSIITKQAGCKYFDDDKKVCRIDAAIDWAYDQANKMKKPI